MIMGNIKSVWPTLNAFYKIFIGTEEKNCHIFLLLFITIIIVGVSFQLVAARLLHLIYYGLPPYNFVFLRTKYTTYSTLRYDNEYALCSVCNLSKVLLFLWVSTQHFVVQIFFLLYFSIRVVGLLRLVSIALILWDCFGW